MDELVYRVGTRIRLTCDVGGAKAGSEGIVIGYYRKEPPAYCVTIDGRPTVVPPTQLEVLADDG